MKNIIKMVGLMVLISFSFFYTDKVIDVIREEDEIMIELSSVEDIYKVLPINANVVGNTIIPGLNGRNINIDESYKKMKSNGIFNKNLIVYDITTPEININNNKDKFIIKGNNNKQMVSLVFVLDDDKYLDKIVEIANNKEVIINYFVSYTYLVSNSTKIKEMNLSEFYSYGDNGKYIPDNLLFSNNLISRIKNNEANLCLAINKEEEILKLCNENNLYTITPNIIGKTTPYNIIKNKLSSGSIILLTQNQETIIEFPTIIDYIKGKGYKIGGLSTLLNENLS